MKYKTSPKSSRQRDFPRSE